MIQTIYRRNDAPSTPAPVFDPALVLIDPLTSPVPPTWRMTDDPEWTALVAELGDPRSVDDRVVDQCPVEVTVEVVDDADVEVEAPPLAVVEAPELAETVAIEAPPTLALDRDLVEWCSTCDADAGDPCRTPSGAVKIGVHPIRVAA